MYILLKAEQHSIEGVVSKSTRHAVCIQTEYQEAFAGETQALRPTPYALHPTPYTLHPTPDTLHPTPGDTV